MLHEALWMVQPNNLLIQNRLGGVVIVSRSNHLKLAIEVAIAIVGDFMASITFNEVGDGIFIL